MPFIRFMGFAIVIAFPIAFVAFMFGSVAGKTVNYHGFRRIGSFGWTDAVIVALFVWGYSAALCGYLLPGMIRTLQLREIPFMRGIMIFAAVMCWIAATLYVGDGSWVGIISLAIYTLMALTLGTCLGERHDKDA